MREIMYKVLGNVTKGWQELRENQGSEYQLQEVMSGYVL